MAHSEDCSSVLEQFVHDVANLPAEINHLMEEIHAKDATMAECRTIINSRDSSLQKFIRLNGSLAPNAKEDSYNKAISENLDKSITLQEEKIKLADRASALLDRQIKQLDVKLRDLTRAGLLPNDPALPSLLATKPTRTNLITSGDGASGIKPTNGNTPTELAASSASPNTPISAYTPAQRLAIARGGNLSGSAAGSQATPRGSTSSTASHATPGPNAAAIHLQRQREASVSGGADPKRRRLSHYPGGAATASLRASNELVAPSPRAGTPASAASGQTAGSHGPKTTVVIKKAATGGNGGTGNKKVAPHQQLTKIKVGSGSTKGHKHISSLSSNRGLKVSSGAGAAVAAAAAARTRSPTNGVGASQLQSDEEDSVLSSPEGSDVDALTGTVIASSPAAEGDVELMDIDPEGVEEHVDGEDTKVYCTCRTVSHGDMVACDNENCPYEWFHWKCVGLTREPPGTWYCEECRERLEK